MLEIRVLGQFELRRDGAVVQLPSRPAQSLLAYLALSAGTAHRREKLAGLLWPDSDEDNARNSLRHALWRIRKTIEPDDVAPPYLLTDDLAVSFNAGADFWLDAAVLARQTDGLQEQLEAAAVFRGELLPGFYDDWITLERERFDSLFRHKMQRVLDDLIAERRWQAVLEWGERWVALGHAPEPGYRAVMRAHAEMGDRSAMAAAFQRCREALFNDLGVEPSIQTRRLFERLRQGDGELVLVSVPIAETQAPAPGDPPFQGLQYFDEADADRFFGRERLTERLVSRQHDEPFLAVTGASGSGKSSVVRAGLIPALRRLANGSPGAVHVLTPTAHPLDALAASLVPTDQRALLVDELGRDPHGLRRFLQRRRQQSIVLVIDQFEELFTLCPDPFEREAFTENLLGTAGVDTSARVVLAIRADFYVHCAQYPALREAVAHHQEYVGPLEATELRHAIEGPAIRGGWELEPGLVELLLRDVGDEPGALPLLSHALLETWKRRHGRRLTLAGYSESGGVQGAIAQTAETVFARQLSPHQRAIARTVFLRLTELGEGTQDTRRRATFDELVHRPEDEPEVRAVLGVLADARLVTLGAATAEVAHEALIREWSRLRAWLAQDRDDLRIQRQLSAAAYEWERLGHDSGGLYRGARLTQANEWASSRQQELNSLENAFLGASNKTAQEEVAEREAQRQRELDAAQQLAAAERRRAEVERERAEDQRQTAGKLRQRAALLTAAFVLAVLMAGTAIVLGNTARNQADLAQAEARAAISRALSAAALTNLNLDPELAALLALRAADSTYAIDGTWTPEAEDALHRVAPLLRAQLTLAGHTGKVLSVAFSPDGLRVATAGEDGTVRLWSAVSGQTDLVLSGHSGPVNAVAFSPDGRLLATASDDRTARIWDSALGQERLTLAGNAREIERLAFSPDGARLATTSLDGTVTVWDPATGQNQLTFHPGREGDSAIPLDVAFSPDGAHLATVVPEGDVSEWDLSSQPPQLVRSWRSSATGVTARSVAFSPDGTRLAATTDSGAQLWWTLTGEPALNIVGHPLQILSVAFSPDGTRVATVSVDQTAKVWDLRSGRELLTLAGHHAPVAQLAFSPDSQRLATASWDGTAKIWDLSPAHELLTIETPGTLAAASVGMRPGNAPLAGQVAISKDGDRILTGLWDGTAKLWDARTGQELLSLSGHAGRVWGAAISPDGSRLATGGDDRTVRVWDGSTGAPIWTGADHSDRVVAVAFSPDGRRLASASADTTVRIWEAATGNELFMLPGQTAPLTSLEFSPDGSRLVTATAGTDANVNIWSASSGQLLDSLTGHRQTIWSVDFSSDGARLVTANDDGTATVFDGATGAPLLTLASHGGIPVSAVFSPDGRKVVTGSRDGTIQLFDAQAGSGLLTLEPADVGDGVDGVAFSPDGRQLIVRTDQAVRTYALSIDDLTALVQSRLTRWWTLQECQRFLHVDPCPAPPAATVRQSATPVVARAAHLFQPAQLVPAPAVPVPMLARSSPLAGTIKIVSSMWRDAYTKLLTDQIIKAYNMALEERDYRVGNASIQLVDLSDSTASRGSWDAPTEMNNAADAVNDPSVLVYLGPSVSAMARAAIPVLCPAQLPIIGFDTTYPGLTKPSPYDAPGEPDIYYPNCQRNFARVVPTDELQGAAAAQFAKQLGARIVYVVHDGTAYGRGVAGVFASTAARNGLALVGGPEGMDPAASDYRALAERIRQSNPDLVYFGGLDGDNAPKLWQDLRAALGTKVTFMGADGISEDSFVTATGSAAEGTYATFPGIPAARLSGKGAEWYLRYKQAFHEEPQPYVAYAYEAMKVALDALERAGKMDRAAIRDAIFATRDYDGILGKWSFTETGDTTLTTMSVWQVRNGAWDPSTMQIIEAGR